MVLEGKYWKRKLAAVTAEYKKWRMFYRNKILGWTNKDGTEMVFHPLHSTPHARKKFVSTFVFNLATINPEYRETEEFENDVTSKMPESTDSLVTD